MAGKKQASGRKPTADSTKKAIDKDEDGPSWVKIWAAIITGVFGVAAAAVPVWIVQTKGCRRETPKDVTIEVFVVQEGGPRSLANVLPIDSSAELHIQVEANVPAGEHPTLFWIDTEGAIHEIPMLDMQQEPDGRQLYKWPSSPSGQKVGGPAGTEVLFVCTAAQRAPVLNDLSLASLGRKWSALPPKVIVRFDRLDVKLDDDRGPEETTPPGADYKQRAQELRLHLAGRVSGFAGLAFPRVRSAAPP
jgi:hypothetical protein